MKRTIRALFVMLAVALAWAAPAMGTELRVGVVDVDEVLQKTEQGRAAIEAWTAYRQEKETEAQERLVPMKEALEGRVAEFQRQMESMRPDAREKKQELLQKQFKELMDLAKEYEAEAQKKYEEIMGPIHKKMQEVIYDIGIRDSYTLILRKAEAIVLFATSRIDITEDVIREFNARSGASGGGGGGGEGGGGGGGD